MAWKICDTWRINKKANFLRFCKVAFARVRANHLRKTPELYLFSLCLSLPVSRSHCTRTVHSQREFINDNNFINYSNPSGLSSIWWAIHCLYFILIRCCDLFVFVIFFSLILFVCVVLLFLHIVHRSFNVHSPWNWPKCVQHLNSARNSFKRFSKFVNCVCEWVSVTFAKIILIFWYN